MTTRPHGVLLAGLALGLCLFSCELENTVGWTSACFRNPEGCALATADAGPSWGLFAATLRVPVTPVIAEPLVVDTAQDALVEGGENFTDRAQVTGPLSLRQAVWLANNSPRDAAVTIKFDVAVFDPQRPATIELGPDKPWPTAPLVSVDIDGTNRGVVVQWQQGSTQPTLRFSSFSRVAGLTFLRMGSALEVSTNAIIAACRFGTDGNTLFDCPAGFALKVTNAASIAYNVFARSCGVISVEQSGWGPSIRLNWFGLDPLTGLPLELATGIDFRTFLDPFIADNIFYTSGPAIALTGSAMPLRFGGSIVSNTQGLLLDGGLGGEVGPLLKVDTAPNLNISLNTIRNAQPALIVGAGAVITQNSISGCDGGIQTTSGVPPPVILSVDDGGVSGTCAVVGVVELFAGPGNNGEQFLDRISCLGAWRISPKEPVARGLNFTATLSTQVDGTSPFSAPYPVP